MTDKTNDASEPPLDWQVMHKIERYLRQLAPHQKEREGPQLLREAVAEIDRLRKLLQQVLVDAHAQDVLLEWWHALECEAVHNV